MRIEHPLPRHIPGLKRLWMDVFGDTSEYLDLFFSTGYAPENCLLIEDEGDITAALYWLDMDYVSGKLAYIYAVATDPAFRGQGLCRRLLTRTHEILANRGYAGAILVPQGENLFALYEKFGYRTGSGIREFTAAPTQPISLIPLDAQAYAAKRKALLPKAVHLGERALALLAATAEFYEGDGFVIACARHNGRFFAPEYLGDDAVAGSILAALDCRDGRFRMPGNDIPFTMFLPLKPDAEKPSHLGFAFD